MIRSFLNTPAHKKSYIKKALHSSVDAVVIDLEDGVGESEKEEARLGLKSNWNKIKASEKEIFVRINNLHSENGILDVSFLLINQIKPRYIVLPKIESGIELELNRKLFGKDIKLCPIIETARGVSNARSIISNIKSGDYVFFGEADLTADLGTELYSQFVKGIKKEIVLLASSNKVNAVDSPCFHLKNISFLKSEITFSVQSGFAAKMAIHPDQIELINKIFDQKYSMTAKDLELLNSYRKNNISINDNNIIGPPMIRKIINKRVNYYD